MARSLTEKEKKYIISVLKRTGSVSEDEYKDRFSWNEVINAAKSPHVLILVVVCFLSGNMRSLSVLP